MKTLNEIIGLCLDINSLPEMQTKHEYNGLESYFSVVVVSAKEVIFDSGFYLNYCTSDYLSEQIYGALNKIYCNALFEKNKKRHIITKTNDTKARSKK